LRVPGGPAKPSDRPGRLQATSISIPLSAPHDDLVRIEVDVLHAKPRALEHPEASAVEQQGHEPQHPFQPVDHRLHLGPAHHDGQDFGRLRAHDSIEGREIQLERSPIQEQQRRQRLVLRRRAHPPLSGQPGEKLVHPGSAYLTRVALPVKHDVSSDPANVRVLGAPAQMMGARGPTNHLEQPERRPSRIALSYAATGLRSAFHRRPLDRRRSLLHAVAD